MTVERPVRSYDFQFLTAHTPAASQNPGEYSLGCRAFRAAMALSFISLAFGLQMAFIAGRCRGSFQKTRPNNAQSTTSAFRSWMNFKYAGIASGSFRPWRHSKFRTRTFPLRVVNWSDIAAFSTSSVSPRSDSRSIAVSPTLMLRPFTSVSSLVDGSRLRRSANSS